MPTLRSPFVLLACLLAMSATGSGNAHAGGEPAFEGKSDCRIAPVNPAPTRVGVTWSGACKDGYADGKGVLEWYGHDDRAKRRLDTILVRGEIGGTGRLTYPGGAYLGSFRQATPHGAGYFEYKDGAQYEGGVVDGKEEGIGTRISPDGSTYEGQWKAGKRHGRGKEVFTLGGRYDGEWRDDAFNGKGTIVYGGSGRTWSGEFRDGRAADAKPVLRRAAKKTDDGRPRFGPFVLRSRTTNPAIDGYETAWAALSIEQQYAMRSSYPALDDRDDPPYPLTGMRALHEAFTEFYAKYRRLQPEGAALIYVTVGPDGVPTTAKSYMAPHPDIGRFAAMSMMMQRFKPALCAGTPCEMIFPVMFSFEFED